MQNWDFLAGVIVGFVAAGMFGVLSQRRRVAKGKMGASRRPQTVVLKTDKTPKEVVDSSAEARISFLLWTVALVGAGVLFALLMIKVAM